MRLRRITLENVRRFTNRVTVGPIGDGVTLLSEPNEAGKSTLFDALHALFFIRHGARSADIKSLQPHSGGKVSVSCDLEHDGALWTLRKEWLSGASAKVWRDGALIHQNEAAEDWIAALVAGDAGGPGGLLWVRQGRVSLRPPSSRTEAAQELQERRDLLTAISGAMDQVTGGERMDRLRDRVELDLAKLATTTGRPKAGGRWADAEAAVDALEQQEAEQVAFVDALREDLDERRRLATDLEALENEEAQEKRAHDVTAAEGALRAAESLAEKVAAALSRACLARQTFSAAEAERKHLASLQDEAHEAKAARGDAARALEMQAAALVQAQARHAAAKTRLTQAREARRAAEELLRQIDRREAASRAGDERQRLQKALSDAQAAEELRIAKVALAQRAPDVETVKHIEALAQAFEARQLARQAAAPRVSAQYAPGAAPFVMGGETLKEGIARPLPVDGQIEMPGVGMLQVSAMDDDMQAALEQAGEELHAALAAGEWSDLAELRTAARQREAAERVADQAAQSRDMLAPEGLEALASRLASLGNAPDEDKIELPDRATAEGNVQQALADLAEAEALAEAETEMLSLAAVAAGQAETAERAAATRLERADAALRDLPRTNEADHEKQIQELRTEAEAAEAEHERLLASSPDIDHLRARRDRLKGIAENAVADSARLRAKLSRLDGRIETRAEEGVEEALEDVRGRLETARRTLQRVEFEKDVLVQLINTLEAAQKAARDTYFAPVAAELRPLMAEIWEDADLVWSDDTLLPAALVRRGTQEPIDVLSGGTQEQIAFLVRLAFARLLAKSGRHAPLILDDALVYSDDDRIEKMFDALHGSAGDLQVIVLSCRQRAFRDLGAPAVTFSAAEDV